MKYIIGISMILSAGCYTDSNNQELQDLFLDDSALIEFCSGFDIEEYNRYDALTKDCLSTLYLEQFEGEPNWFDESQSGCRFRFQGEQYIGQCSADINFYVSCRDCPDINTDNMQIDIDINVDYVSSNSFSSINFGGAESLSNIYRFGYDDESRFSIYQNLNEGENAKRIVEDQVSNIIVDGYNKLSIRKLGSIHYFFINEVLVYTSNTITWKGNFVSLTVSAEGAAAFDNLRISRVR